MSGDAVDQVFQLWIYLSQTPLLGLTATLAAYTLGGWIYKISGANPLLNPVLIAVALLVGLLTATGTPYAAYFDGAQFAHFLLGPATVALAIPVFKAWTLVKRAAPAVIAGVAVGSLVAAASAMAIAAALGASEAGVLSIAPKSVTTPIAMGVSEEIGGLPSLTAVLVILTGVLGAATGPYVLNLIGVRDWRARGLAIGVASHGIGAARAFSVDPTAGAFAAVGMGLNALLTAILLPAAFAFMALL